MAMKHRTIDQNTTDEFETTESAVRYYCRDIPQVFRRAANALVWDENDVEYVDFLSACGSLNYGHNHPQIKSRVLEYLADDGILNGLDLHTTAKRAFLRSFREIILEPRGMAHRVQFTGPTGTNAVEAALKLARKVTGRNTVVAFTNAFHGMTLGSLSVTGRRFGGSRSYDVIRLPYDGYCGAGVAELDRFERMVKDASGGLEAPAAIIVETIQGEGGLRTARPEWLRHLAKLAGRLGALLIIDDVQAGCGRTGQFFSFEEIGINPDVVCLAKSIGGIGLPMAIVLINPHYDRWAPGEHNGTFRGNNLAFVAAEAALRFWRDAGFLRCLASSSATIQDWIKCLSAEFGDAVIRPCGRGLMSGLSFKPEGLARQVVTESLKRGVLVETSGALGEVIKLMPPLTIEKEVLEAGLARLKSAIASALHCHSLKNAA